MVARSILLAGVRAPALQRRSFASFACSSSAALSAAQRPRSHLAGALQQSRFASSGPSQPITSQGTPREANPADPVTKTVLPAAAASTSSSATRPSLSTSETVDAITRTTSKGGLGGSAVPGGSSGSSGSGYSSSGSTSEEPKIIIEKVKRSWARRWVVRFARAVLVLVLSGGSYILYTSYVQRHPPNQLPFDPSKKNLVILGNGWASTSLLKALDTEGYNVTVVSPRNYFLFTPLLPSVTVGTLESRSIIEPTRFITRHKTRAVDFLEGEATEIDVTNKTLTVVDNSENKGEVSETVLPYDYLVVNVGAANQTFGIKGVTEHACFLKEAEDAGKIRTRLMDCIETATFKGQSEEELKRLLHMVVVGGGPTGVEYAAELHDYLVEDLQTWYPDIADKVKITLIEALPNVLPMFSKQLIDYTSETFKENKIEVLTRTMVKEVGEKHIIAQDEKKNLLTIPYGLLVWATGNTARPLTKAIMSQIGDNVQNQRRGLVVDDHMRVAGAEGIWACGDCTATNYAPTGQVAAQQGKYLARQFNQLAQKETLELALEEARQAKSSVAAPQAVDVEQLVKQYNRVAKVPGFAYTHQGSLAYIGSDKAIADIPWFNGNIASGGLATYWFWRSAYISTLFSLRNRTLVVIDWTRTKIFGRDTSRE